MSETLSTVSAALHEKYQPEGVIELGYQEASAWPLCPRSSLSGQDVEVVSKIMAGAQNRSATAATAAAKTTTQSTDEYKVPPVLDFDQQSFSIEAAYAGNSEKVFNTASQVIDQCIGNISSRLDRDYFGERGGEIGQVATDPGTGTTLTLTNAEDAHNLEVNQVLLAYAASDYYSLSGTLRAGSMTVAALPTETTSAAVTTAAAINSAVAVDDFIVVDGDYANKRAGLGDWNPADLSAYDLTDNFYGVSDRDDMASRAAGSRTLDTGLSVKDALDELVYACAGQGGKPDLAWMSIRTLKQFSRDIGSQSPDSEIKAEKGGLTDVGYKGFKYMAATGATLTVMGHRYCKPNQLRVLKKDDWKMTHYLGEPLKPVDLDGRIIKRTAGFTYGVEVTSHANFFAKDTRCYGVATLATVT